jgi:hypothetical protein
MGAVVDSFGVLPDLSPLLVELVLTLPIAVQEMVLAGWFIGKGVAGAPASSGSA